MSKSDEIRYVDPPKLWIGSKAVICEEGTRWYMERGPDTTFRLWLKELCRGFRSGLIPLQWVPDYVGVSRAAVYKRAKAGGLTVFSFIVTENTKNILGRSHERDTRRRYDFASLRECEMWRRILLDRAGEAMILTGNDVGLERIEKVASEELAAMRHQKGGE